MTRYEMDDDRTLLELRSTQLPKGFTLIELMVTLSVIAILAGLAAPSFNDAILSNKLSSYANNFVASATVARGEALKRNAPVTLCRSGSGTACATSGGWQQGWIIFNDKNSDGTINSDETLIQRQQALSADYSFTGDVYNIAFSSIGVGATAANLKLCRGTPTAGSQEREIKVSTTGRVSVTKTTTNTCL